MNPGFRQITMATRLAPPGSKARFGVLQRHWPLPTAGAATWPPRVALRWRKAGPRSGHPKTDMVRIEQVQIQLHLMASRAAPHGSATPGPARSAPDHPAAPWPIASSVSIRHTSQHYWTNTPRQPLASSGHWQPEPGRAAAMSAPVRLAWPLRPRRHTMPRPADNDYRSQSRKEHGQHHVSGPLAALPASAAPNRILPPVHLIHLQRQPMTSSGHWHSEPGRPATMPLPLAWPLRPSHHALPRPADNDHRSQSHSEHEQHRASGPFATLPVGAAPNRILPPVHLIHLQRQHWQVLTWQPAAQASRTRHARTLPMQAQTGFALTTAPASQYERLTLTTHSLYWQHIALLQTDSAAPMVAEPDWPLLVRYRVQSAGAAPRSGPTSASTPARQSALAMHAAPLAYRGQGQADTAAPALPPLASAAPALHFVTPPPTLPEPEISKPPARVSAALPDPGQIAELARKEILSAPVMDKVARDVMQRLEKQLRIERERRGL